MILFSAHLAIGEEQIIIDYRSVDACLHDEGLARLLDTRDSECVIWIGTTRLTGKPIQDFHELKKAVIENATTILRRLL